MHLSIDSRTFRIFVYNCIIYAADFLLEQVKKHKRHHGRDQEENAGNEAGERQRDGSRVAL